MGATPGRVGVLLRAGAATAPSAAWLAQVEALLGLDAPDVLRYADPRRGQSRSVRLQAHEVGGQAAGTRVMAFMLAGDIQAAGWVSALLVDDLPAQSYGRALLAGTLAPPVAVPSRGVQVCNCFDVTEPQIVAILAQCSGSAEARLAQLQATLKCGTQCGSCLPALRQQVQRVPAAIRATIQTAMQTAMQTAL